MEASQAELGRSFWQEKKEKKTPPENSQVYSLYVMYCVLYWSLQDVTAMVGGY